MIGYLRTRVHVPWTTATNDTAIQHTVQTDSSSTDGAFSIDGSVEGIFVES